MFSILVLTLSFALCETVKAQKFRVLITNDDGVEADGISAIVDQLALNPNLDLTVIEPENNKSGTGDEFTTDE